MSTKLWMRKVAVSVKIKWFQPVHNSEKLEIQELPDSGDDDYVDEAGVLISGEWKKFCVHNVRSTNIWGRKSSWRTVIDKGN